MKKSVFMIGLTCLCLAMPVLARGTYQRVVDKTYYVDQFFEQDNKGQEKIYIFLGNQRIATFENEDLHFPVVDHLGSPAIITNENGEVVEINDYGDYGNIVNQNSSIDNGYKFIGKEVDSETDLQYFGQRYYNAPSGRFVSIDPLLLADPGRFLADPQQLNSYSYARNNPIAWIDFWGLSSATMNSEPEGGWALDQVMGQFNGVTAYYNGIGSKRKTHSCVEYAKRYMSEVYGINGIGEVKNPRNMWNIVDAVNKNLANAGSDYYFTQHHNGQGFNLPKEGDLLIWTQGTYGHVMVVTESVFDNNTNTGHVEIIDQNASSRAVSEYGIKKTDSGYSVLRKDGKAMAGWLSPVNKNNAVSAPASTGPVSASFNVSAQRAGFFQRMWNSTRIFFGGLFK